ncbi:hypothetical protein H4S14_003505 [Agrobacterium vitis]|nr:hypothetical protein [Agrobacterium vitis]MBE1439740.1 hypothetical protein [Agrobacterium vitis]
MNFKIMLTAGLALALAGCTTTSGGVPVVAKKNAAQVRWEGQSAGKFFAQFGPPISDVQSGSTTTYTWRGGFKTRKVAAEGNSKATRTQYLSCQVNLTVSSDYVIEELKTVADRPYQDGKTWCEVFLGGA